MVSLQIEWNLFFEAVAVGVPNMKLFRVLSLRGMTGNRLSELVTECAKTILLSKTSDAMSPYRIVGRVELGQLLEGLLTQIVQVAAL